MSFLISDQVSGVRPVSRISLSSQPVPTQPFVTTEWGTSDDIPHCARAPDILCKGKGEKALHLLFSLYALLPLIPKNWQEQV